MLNGKHIRFVSVSNEKLNAKIRNIEHNHLIWIGNVCCVYVWLQCAMNIWFNIVSFCSSFVFAVFWFWQTVFRDSIRISMAIYCRHILNSMILHLGWRFKMLDHSMHYVMHMNMENMKNLIIQTWHNMFTTHFNANSYNLPLHINISLNLILLWYGKYV